MSFYKGTFQITQEDVLPSTYNLTPFILLPVSFIMLVILFIVAFFAGSLPFIILGAGIFLVKIVLVGAMILIMYGNNLYHGKR